MAHDNDPKERSGSVQQEQINQIIDNAVNRKIDDVQGYGHFHKIGER